MGPLLSSQVPSYLSRSPSIFTGPVLSFTGPLPFSRVPFHFHGSPSIFTGPLLSFTDPLRFSLLLGFPPGVLRDSSTVQTFHESPRPLLSFTGPLLFSQVPFYFHRSPSIFTGPLSFTGPLLSSTDPSDESLSYG